MLKWLLLPCCACVLAAATGISGDPAAQYLSVKAGSNPMFQPITVSTADGTSAWTASASSKWLTLSATEGSGFATIIVSADTTGLAPGLYTDVVRLQLSDGRSTGVIVTLQIAPSGSPQGNEWHVTPDGTDSGDGSRDHPWDIVTALHGAGHRIQPGDTVWLHDGKYGSGAVEDIIGSTLVGTPSAPIVVRAWPGERPIIDAWLQIGCCDQDPQPQRGAYTWFWGIEFASYNPDRHSGTSGPPDYARQQNHASIDSWAPGTKIINCIVHDTSTGIEMWDEAGDAEAYGNLVYNIGGYGSDRGHGHGFYMQNAGPGYKHLFDNVTFNNFGEGIQLFGSNESYIQNFHLEGNVSFNNGAVGTGGNSASDAPPAGSRNDNLIIGAGNGGPKGVMLLHNFLYHTPSADDGANDLSYYSTPRAHDLAAIGNYFIGGSEGVDVTRWDSVTFRDNTIYAARQNETSLTYRDDQNPAAYSYDYNRYFGSGQFTVAGRCNAEPCKRSTVDFGGWQSAVGVDAHSVFSPGRPAGAWTFVRPNLYEPGRANIVAYNWDQAPEVAVDLRYAGLAYGDTFQIRDAENWFAGPLVTGVYIGQQVVIPMTGLAVAPPVGTVPNPQPHTGPQFGVFVLLSGAAANVF